MKIVVINGVNHKGSTYHITHELLNKLDGEIKEFFLPKDFNEFCLGCTNCFKKGEELCPHRLKLEPIEKALIEADLIILDSPVYVYHTTGQMKALLDHFGYMWMVHRPKKEMFSKQAVVISSAAGAGMKSCMKDMADSLFFFGVAKTYKIGYAVKATSYDMIDLKIKKKIEKKTLKISKKINKKYGKVKPGLKTKAFFFLMHLLQKNGWNPIDKEYWNELEWTKKKRPWK